MNLRYAIAIQWSEEDNCYLVQLPDFPSQQFHTHGDTDEEALKNALEVLELLVEEYQQDGKPHWLAFKTIHSSLLLQG